MFFPELPNKKRRAWSLKTQKRRADSPRQDTDRDAFTDCRMNLKQVIVFALGIMMCAASRPCYTEDKLEEAASHKLHSHFHQPSFPSQASTLPPRCPLELYKRDHSMKGRSISPWAYVQRNLPEHFPSTYYEAQCLCEGCIVLDESGVLRESSDYNSAPVVQNRVFLKRELCEAPVTHGEARKYHLRPVSVNVTVACTCVRPLYQ